MLSGVGDCVDFALLRGFEFAHANPKPLRAWGQLRARGACARFVCDSFDVSSRDLAISDLSILIQFSRDLRDLVTSRNF